MGLPIVTLVMFASAAGVPTGIPIAVVLMLSGAYLVGSLPGLAMALVVVAAAELGGTLLLHLIARTGGVRLLERMASDRQERVNATFSQWRGRLGGRDVPAIAALRLIPFVRMGTTVGTGLMGVRLRDFIWGSAIAAVIWTGVPISLGYAFRSNLEVLEGYYGRASDTLPFLLGFSVLALVIVVLGRSAATRARLREMGNSIWPFGRGASSLPEHSQETPPLAR